jgi:K+-sensing histidine kinase KdpD
VLNNNTEIQASLDTHLAMLHSVSHDIRGAFGIISGLTSLLPFAANEEERNDMMYRLQKNSAYALHMFTSLQDYALISSGKSRIEIADFNPGRLFNDIERKWIPTTERRGIQFSISRNDVAHVSGDEQMTTKIVENIVLYLLNKSSTNEIAIEWFAHEPNEWFCSIECMGSLLPACILQEWNDNTTTSHWQQGDDLCLTLALLAARELGATTSVKQDKALRQISFKLNFNPIINL